MKIYNNIKIYNNMKIYKLLTCIKNCKYINLYYLYIKYINY